VTPWTSTLGRLLLAAVAGLAAAAAFEPLAWVWMLVPAVAGLSLAVHGTRGRRAFLVGLVFGLGFMGGLLPWLSVIGRDAWVGLSLLEAAFFGLLGLALGRVGRLPAWPLWTAACWVAVEVLRSWVPWGGFPWGRLAFATIDTPVAAAPTLAGRPALAAEGTVRVAIVQGDVPGEGMDAFAERRAVLDNHVEATLALADDIDAGTATQPDFVLWPENSTDIDPFSDASVYDDIQGAVDAVGVPVLVGAMVSGRGPSDVENQGIVWSPGEGPGESYSKTHPVPFGEYIPMRAQLAKLFERLDQIPRDMVPGTEPGLLDLAGTTIGDLICFEVAYDGLVRDVVDGGAGMLVVQTNNATYMGTGQVEQQFAIARLRAVETGRSVAVAATNGVSGVVAPDGAVVERAPVRTRTVLEDTITLRPGVTPGVRWGQTLEIALTVLAVVAVVLAGLVGPDARRRRRTPAAETATPAPEQQPDPATDTATDTAADAAPAGGAR